TCPVWWARITGAKRRHGEGVSEKRIRVQAKRFTHWPKPDTLCAGAVSIRNRGVCRGTKEQPAVQDSAGVRPTPAEPSATRVLLDATVFAESIPKRPPVHNGADSGTSSATNGQGGTRPGIHKEP